MVCLFHVILASFCLSIASGHEIAELILKGADDGFCYWSLPKEFLQLTHAAADHKVSIEHVMPRLSFKFRESATVREVAEKIWNPLYGNKITDTVIKDAIEKNKDTTNIRRNFYLGNKVKSILPSLFLKYFTAMRRSRSLSGQCYM